MQAMSLPDVSEFYHWQSPRELWSLATKTDNKIPAEDLFNRADAIYKKVMEALVASTFILRLDALVLPVNKIRMAEANKELLDFEFVSDRGVQHEFELVGAHHGPIGLGYRGGRKPVLPSSAFSGIPANPKRIVEEIKKKTAKAIEKHTWRNLLVYPNLQAGVDGLDQLRLLVKDSETVWKSIWLVMGIPDERSTGIALLYPSQNFDCPAGQWLE